MARMDIRQLMAGILTFTMFIMLMNMVKIDYYDIPITDPSNERSFRQGFLSRRERVLVDLSKWPNNGSTDALKPCWTKPLHRKLDQEEPDLGNLKGYIIFSLTGGHENHLSQVSNAIVVARILGATLVLPDIIEERSVERRKFGEIYDVPKFIKSIEGIVKISTIQPHEVSTIKLTLVRVPNGVSENYVTTKVEPLYKKEGNLKIETYFSSLPVTKGEANNITSLVCLAMFEALQLKAELLKSIHSMVETLRSPSQNSDGLFIAVDLTNEILGKEDCQASTASGKQSCYSAHEIGQFLMKIGIPYEATIYLTLNGLHDSLQNLTEIYSNIHTKETLVPDEMVVTFLGPETSVYKKIIDYYICSWSDLYVAAKFDLFYASVVGNRIARGEKIVLDPAESDSEDGIAYISPYMLRKSHYAYSCFC